MSESLAVKYRPNNFSDVVGQDMILAVLKRQLELHSFKNCYLFCGSSGCGKTTVARIFAKEINNGKGFPIEIDAASNNGVESVKSIVANASERSLDSQYKVFIIDECHVITIQGWNAFLKCIEEPPQYTIFIFCTTDPQKIPATILNRCMRFNFGKIKVDQILSRLSYICQNENITNYKESIEVIAKGSNGQMRDAIANLEKVSDYNRHLDPETTLAILGRYSYSKLFSLLNSIIDGNDGQVITYLKDASESITDWKYFVDMFLEFILDVFKYCVLKDIGVTSLPSNYLNDIIGVTNFNDSDKYYSYVLNKVLELKNMIKVDNYPYYTIQTVLLQIARCE